MLWPVSDRASDRWSACGLETGPSEFPDRY
jgi:hypothetical protein